MDGLVLDELSRLDAAFTGNRLLSTFTRETRALFEADATVVELAPGEILFDRGSHVEWSVFPFGPTMISLVIELDHGGTIEVATIGREGAIGGIVSCGHAPAFSQARVHVPGPALKVPMKVLEDAKKRSPFIANIFCRFSDYLLAQVMQSVACNSFHSITQRAARWLLTAQDRAGDRIELTQEALAALLGAQRTTVNAVVRTLQDEGLVVSGRGVVRVADRAGLRHRSCECYQAVERHFAEVIGATGIGGSGDCA